LTPTGAGPGSFFTQNTWVTITGVQFNPARTIVGGITGTSVVTYIDPSTGKTGTLRVQGKTVAGNPQKCPDNESFCLTRAGGIGGQLLLSPTGKILDSKPKPDPNQLLFNQNTWVTITDTVFIPSPTVVVGITGKTLVTYVDPVTNKPGTLTVQGKTIAGNPQACPQNESYCLTRAGGKGGQLLLSTTGKILDSRPKPGTNTPSNQTVDPVTGQPIYHPVDPYPYPYPHPHPGEHGEDERGGYGEGERYGDGYEDGYDDGRGDGDGYGYGTGVVPVTALITVPPTDTSTPAPTDVPQDTSGPADVPNTPAGTSPTNPATLAPDGIPTGQTIFWMSKKTFIIVVLMLCLASLLVGVGYYMYRKHKGVSSNSGGGGGGAGPGGYGNMGLGGGNMGLGGGNMGMGGGR